MSEELKLPAEFIYDLENESLWWGLTELEDFIKKKGDVVRRETLKEVRKWLISHYESRECSVSNSALGGFCCCKYLSDWLEKELSKS